MLTSNSEVLFTTPNNDPLVQYQVILNLYLSHFIAHHIRDSKLQTLISLRCKNLHQSVPLSYEMITPKRVHLHSYCPNSYCTNAQCYSQVAHILVDYRKSSDQDIFNVVQKSILKIDGNRNHRLLLFGQPYFGPFLIPSLNLF